MIVQQYYNHSVCIYVSDNKSVSNDSNPFTSKKHSNCKEVEPSHQDVWKHIIKLSELSNQPFLFPCNRKKVVYWIYLIFYHLCSQCNSSTTSTTPTKCFSHTSLFTIVLHLWVSRLKITNSYLPSLISLLTVTYQTR